MFEKVMERVKKNAPKFPVPQTQEQAAKMLAEIGEHQRERQRIQANMNDKLALVREQFEEQALPHAEAIVGKTTAVQHWFEANRDRLTQGGKTKTVKLATGEVSWRMRPPSCKLRNVKGLIEQIKERGLLQFLRVKEEPNKEAMLAEQELALSLKGVSIEQGEDFVLKPFETQLEEVA